MAISTYRHGESASRTRQDEAQRLLYTVIEVRWTIREYRIGNKALQLK